MMSFVLALFLAAAGVISPTTKVTGKIVDENGGPIRSAQIRIRGAHSSAMVPVDANGLFAVPLESDEHSVRIDVTAVGFEKRTRELVVINGVADAGSLTMKAIKGLSLSGLSVTLSADTKQNQLDVFVTNEGSGVAQVMSARVQARRRPDTECLDLTPGVLFAIQDQLLAGRIGIDVKAAAAPPDTVSGKGQFLQQGCGQQQVDVTLPYPFALNAGEHTKLRIDIPTALRSSQQALPVAVHLDTFAVVSITFHDGAGRDVAVTRQIADPDKQ